MSPVTFGPPGTYAGIYDATAALRQLLRSQLVKVSATSIVTLLPPGDALPVASGINLYLYRVVESPSTKNQPWPGDLLTASSRRPALGLQLFFLLTPLGQKPDDQSFTFGDDAHTMLGIAMETLQQYPILNDVHLPEFDADLVLPTYIQNSFEKLKTTLLPTSVDELSKIWATINQPYRLSVAYEVSLVQLQPLTPPPVGGGFVTSTLVEVITLDPPRLQTLVPNVSALARIVAGMVTPNQVRLDGFGMSFPGQTPQVSVAGQPASIASPPLPTDNSITIDMPANVVGGPEADVTVELNGKVSAALPLIVSPWLSSVSPIRTALDATVPADMTLKFQGQGLTAGLRLARFDGLSGSSTTPPVAGTDTSTSVPTPALQNGVYDVRLVVAATSMASNSRSLEVIPLIETPVIATVVVPPGVNVTELTIPGARLAGTNTRVIIDGNTFIHGANIASLQMVHVLGRLLPTGPHSLVLNIDGSVSRTINFVVP